jgi:hypothetical protein
MNKFWIYSVQSCDLSDPSRFVWGVVEDDVADAQHPPLVANLVHQAAHVGPAAKNEINFFLLNWLIM